MDLIKIGSYLAEKRKALGLTQRQVAEKLGMSDKSVSKWERGVCLPDVSVYSELCSILGISINEFLAGEDIEEEVLVKKSEENLLGMASDSRIKQRRLKRIVGALIIILLIFMSVAGGWLLWSDRPQNYIAPVEKESVEMKTAEMLSGIDGAFLYQYTATDSYKPVKLYVSEYQEGKLVKKDDWEVSGSDMGSSKKGMVLVVPDFERFVIKFIFVNDGAKWSTEIPILKNVPEREYYGRCAVQMEEQTDITYNKEQGLVALAYDNHGEMIGDSIEAYEDGETSAANDYAYYFSIQFCE